MRAGPPFPCTLGCLSSAPVLPQPFPGGLRGSRFPGKPWREEGSGVGHSAVCLRPSGGGGGITAGGVRLGLLLRGGNRGRQAGPDTSPPHPLAAGLPVFQQYPYR
ncbi:Hypothetical predicted protein [Podarcis lilfordi]|uniref:Uncharacterized protein n=1 Tax=Podarcis lilfordi TaxID=74358 RepID=A0AA35PR77_9SAUR|nr:Hypothetical predicted protein [Podarcis lilfordi]